MKAQRTSRRWLLLGVNVMRAPGQGRLFLLSNFEPGRLERRFGWWTRAQLVIAIAAGATALWLMARMASF